MHACAWKQHSFGVIVTVNADHAFLVHLFTYNYTYALLCTHMHTISVAIVLVAAQFKNINQFLWIAWFQVACGLVLIVLMVLFFRDRVLVPSCPSCKSVQRNRNKRKASTSSTAPLEPSSVPHPVKPMVIFVSLPLTVAYTHTNAQTKHIAHTCLEDQS